MNMPKMKVPKSVANRFKVTKTGKILRRKIGTRHLKMAKSKTNIRRGKVPVRVTGALEKKVKKLLGL